MAESGKKTSQRNAKRRRRANRRRDQSGTGAGPQAAGAEATASEDVEATADAQASGNGRAASEGEVSSLLHTTGDEVKQLLEAADDAAKMIREAAQTGTPPSAPEPGDRGERKAGASDNARQLLDSAEEAAEKIRQEAREDARQFLDEARRRAEGVLTEEMHRVTLLTEDLVREAGAVQGQLESLRAAFDQAIRRMGAELKVDDEGVWGTPDEDEGAGSGESAESLRSRLGRRRRRTHIAPERFEGVSEGARLLALQQMMAGEDAKVIEKRLKTEFGIEDPGPLLKWMGMEAPRT